MHRYVDLYNHQLPQAALRGKTPLEAMKEWFKSNPELFHRGPYDRPGCDIHRRPYDCPGCDIYGPGWSKLGKKTSWRGVAAGPVWGDDYARTLAQARIGLGLLSKRYPDAFTTRSFEIPASGAMLLAERTTEHQALFKEDHEAIFFGSHEELRDKISFYLRNEGARRAIAAAGRARALAQYHWRHVLQPAIRRTEEIARGR